MKVSSQKKRNLIVILLALILSIILGICSHDLIIGGTILFTSLLSAYLASIGYKTQYLISALNYVLMGYVALKNQLFGSGGFYILACMPLQIWGFWQWSKNLNRSGSVKKRRFTTKVTLVVLTSCITGSFVVGYLLSLIPGQRLNWLDATSNCVNLCGIILMAMRYAEAWWIWLINNAIDLTIWIIIFVSGTSGEAPMMLASSITYLVINIYGAWKWWRESKITNIKRPHRRRS